MSGRDRPGSRGPAGLEVGFFEAGFRTGGPGGPDGRGVGVFEVG